MSISREAGRVEVAITELVSATTTPVSHDRSRHHRLQHTIERSNMSARAMNDEEVAAEMNKMVRD